MNANAIISSILNLLGRLELDRQDTQNTLTQQEVLSQDLREDLGRENERKQELLLQSVQGGTVCILSTFSWRCDQIINQTSLKSPKIVLIAFTS